MISTQNVSLQYGDRALFENVNIKFTSGNCYGVIGANGAGKSTFLKILSGEIEPNKGEVILEPNKRLSMLKQDHFAYEENEVLETVIMGNARLYEIMQEKEKLYAKADFNDEDGIKLAELEGEFAEMDGWNAEVDGEILLNGLGISEEYHHLKMKELEANQKVKVLLAQALFGNPDVLLLDEPTNHLDMHSVRWLENFLMNFKNTVIVVSHDRHFLNLVCTYIVDIDYKKMKLYAGNYDFWRQSSELLLKQIKEQNRKKEDKIKELKEFIARFSANASKSKQATSRKKILEKIELEELTPSSRKYPFISFKFEKPNSREVLIINNLTVIENNKKLLNKISFTVLKGDKIALIGSNIQKTLLLEILSKNKKYTSGEFKWSVNSIIGYFPADNTKLFKTNQNIIEWLGNFQKIDDVEVLRSFLGRMLFSGDGVFKKVNVLSGGEKARCLLAKIMLENPNVLLLDEPTNHLDLESITSLNNGMQKFSGEIIFTTQDYELNDTIANRVIEIFENGTILDRRMSYSEYIIDESINKLREKNRI